MQRQEKCLRNIDSPCSINHSLASRPHRTSFKIFFCSAVNVVGNLMFTPTTKSPLSLGFLLLGIPCCGKRSVHVGGVGPECLTGTCFPSIVWTVRLHPVRASLRSISIVNLISSPSLLKRGCGFYQDVSISRNIKSSPENLPLQQ